MNDFTKEELQQIVKWATTDIDLNPSELEFGLFERIVAMIYNYCEHESDFGARPHSKFSVRKDPKTWGYTCKKCGEFYR